MPLKRSHLSALAAGIMFIFIPGTSYAPAAPGNKVLVYEGRTISEWVKLALTAERDSMAFRDAVIALTHMKKRAVLTELIKAMENKDDRLRVRSILLIATYRREAKAAVPGLIRALKDEHRSVRASAAMTLGRLGDEAEEARRPLRSALNDTDVRVRVYAASALALIDHAETKAMVAHLRKLLKADNSEVRYYATHALGNIGSEDGLAALSQALADEDVDVRLAAASSLQEFGRKAEPAVPALIRALTDRSGEVRQKAADALGAIGPAAKSAVTSLIGALKDEDWGIRGTSASALGRIGAGAKRAEGPLKAALDDDNPIVCVHAACALARINPKLMGAMVPRLIRALQSEDASVRVSAIGALIALRAKAAVGPLIEAIKDSDALVRSTAAFALKRIDPAAAR